MIHSELAFVTKAIGYFDIEEVVMYNLAIGFEKITIFDNESYVDLSNLAKEFPQVKIYPIKGFPDQCNLYTQVCKQSKSKWVCLQDDDETLYMRDYDNVNEFLERFDQFSGVAINLKEMSTREAIKTYSDVTQDWVEQAIWLNPNEDVRRHVTTIVKPQHVNVWHTPHIPSFKSGHVVMPNGTPAIGPAGNIICDEATFYHYKLKDYDYHKKKIERGCADDGRKRPMETWEEYQALVKRTYTVKDTLMKEQYLRVLGE